MLTAGILFCVAGIALLIIMIIKARNITNLPEANRPAAFQKLVALNFGGLFCGIIGLVLIVLAFFLA